MKKKPLIIVAAIVVVLILIVLMLPFVIDVNKFKPEIQTQMSTALGRQVTVGNLRLSILSGGVEVDDLAIADDPAFSHSSFVTAKEVTAGVALLPLIFSGQLGVSSFTIENPQVSLVHNAAGKWNFSTMGGPANGGAKSSSGSPTKISIEKLSVKNGTVSVSTIGKSSTLGKTRSYEAVDMDASDVSFSSAFPFTLSLKTPGGGTVKVDGKVGPINPADAAATPLTAKVEVNGADLALSGFIDPASGIGGIADVTANVDSSGDSMQVAGSLKVDKLKAATNGSPAKVPVSVDYDTTFDVKHEMGSLKRGDIHIGKVTMHLTGNYNTAGATPTLQMKLNGQGMSIPELEGVLPAAGISLPPNASLQAGTLDLNLSITGPADKLTIAGPVNMANGKIDGFSVKSKMGPLASLMGVGGSGNDTEIQSLHTDLRQDPSGTHAANLDVVIVGVGTVTGDANVSPSGELNCKMVAKLAGAGGAVLGAPGKLVGGIGKLAGGGNSQGGSSGGIPFTVTGTTANPIVTPSAGAVAGQAATGLVKAPVGAASSAVGGIGGLFGHKKSN